MILNCDVCVLCIYEQWWVTIMDTLNCTKQQILIIMQVSIHDQVIHMQHDDECARCDSSRKRIYLTAHLQLQIPYQHQKSCLGVSHNFIGIV